MQKYIISAVFRFWGSVEAICTVQYKTRIGEWMEIEFMFVTHTAPCNEIQKPRFMARL